MRRIGEDAAVPARLDLHNPGEWPAVLTATQVADLLQLDRGTVRNMLERGDLQGVRVGQQRQWRIAAEEVWPLVPPPIRMGWPPGPWDPPAPA